VVIVVVIMKLKLEYYQTRKEGEPMYQGRFRIRRDEFLVHAVIRNYVL